MAQGRETRTTFAEQVPLPVAMATYILRQYLKNQKQNKKIRKLNTLLNLNFYCNNKWVLLFLRAKLYERRRASQSSFMKVWRSVKENV